MKRNKKGFTLIELLAVIVILAVVALIATPMVLNLIEKARKGSFARSAEGILKASKLTYSSNLLSNSNGEMDVYDCKDGKCLSNRLNSNNERIPLDIEGKVGDGIIKIYPNGEIDFTISNGKYCAIKHKEEGKINIEDGDCSDVDTRANGKITLSSTKDYYTYPETKEIEIIENLSKGVLTCTSNDEKVATCTITNNILKVTAGTKEGITSITVTAAGTVEYKEASAVYVASTQKGTLNTISASGYTGVYDGKEHGITVTSDNSIIKYGTSKGTYDLDASPKYTDAGEYTVYYEVTKAGYNTVEGFKQVVITKAEGNIELEEFNNKIEYNTEKEIEIKENKSNGDITVTSSNSNIVEAVYENGKIKITGKTVGSATIIVTSASTSNYNEASTNYDIEVTKANNKIELSSTSGSYKYPETGTFEVTSNPSGGILSCETNNKNVADCTISNNVVTVTPGTEEGVATITIKSADTSNYNAGQTAYVATTKKGTLNSISASGYTGVYDGKEHGIIVTSDNSIIKYGTSKGTYDKNESPTYTNVGTYTIYYEVTKAGYNTVEGEKQVVITKAEGSVTAPTAKELTYTGNAQKLINAGSSETGTIMYKLEGGSYSENIPTGINAGTYKVYYMVEGDSNHNNVAESFINVSIGKATLSYTTGGYTGVYDGLEHSITVTSEGANIKYGLSEGTYDLTENPTYKDAGEYIVYYEITREGYVTETGKETVKITKAENKIELSSTSGSYKYPETGTFEVISNPSGGTLSCETNNKNVADCSISNNVVTITPGTEEGVATITIKSEETTNYNAGQTAYVATTLKGTLNSISASGYTGVYDGKEHGITVTSEDSTIMYGLSEGTYDLTSSPTYTNVGTYTIYYQVEKVGYNTVEGEKQVVITKAQGSVTAPTAKTLTYTGSAQNLINAGISETGIIKYKLEGGSYSENIPTGINAGTYKVYYMVEGDSNHNNVAESSINVSIGKANGSVTAPTAKNLTYTGNAQNLINAGSSETGTIQYKLEGGSYSENIPTATNYGIYKVYYKVIGDSNHKDVTEASISVSIGKANNTLTLSSTSASYTYPNNGTFEVTENKSGGTLSCTSSNESVATCSISGTTVTVTPGVEEGVATLTIKSAATANYNEGTVAHVATTKKGTLTSISASGYSGVYDGKEHGISVTSEGSVIKYGNSSTSCTLSDSPTYKDVGTYTVYYAVTKPGYNVVTGSKQVVITKADGTVVAPTAKSLTYTGQALSLINEGSSSTGTIKYKLEGGSYSENIPTGTNAGTYKVYYMVEGDSNHNNVAESSINVTIGKANNTLSLSSGSGVYTYPNTGTFTITNPTGGALSCKSSDENVATCSLSGTTVTVTPVASGTGKNATITITSAETDNYKAGTAAHAVTTKSGTLNTISANGYTGVYDGKAHGISVTCSGATIKYGTSSGTYDKTTSPTYTDVGTYTVYYQITKAGYTTSTGSKQVVISKANNTLTLSTASKEYTYPTSGTFTVSTNTSGGTLSCESSNTNIATCEVNGTTVTVVPGTTSGDVNITVKSASTTNYNAGSSVHKATIKKGTLTVEASGYSGVYDGASHGITVTSSGSTIKYGTTSGTYDKTTSPTYKDAGTYTVYYEVSKAGYNTVTGSKQVVISKANNTLTLSSTSASYTYPNSGTFEVKTNTSGGSLSCTSSDENVATCSISGTTVTVIPGTTAGTSTITVISAGTTNYNAGQAAHVATTKEGTLTSISTSGYTGEYDGAAHGISVTSEGATIMYGTSSGIYNLTESPTYTDIGTYTIYYQVTKPGYTPVTGSQTITINAVSANNVSYTNNKVSSITNVAEALDYLDSKLK